MHLCLGASGRKQASQGAQAIQARGASAEISKKIGAKTDKGTIRSLLVATNEHLSSTSVIRII